MEEKIVSYIRHHTLTIAYIVVLGFLILGVGEYYLYRKVMYVNQMVSEGLMQIKESIKIPTLTVPIPMMKKLK